MSQNFKLKFDDHLNKDKSPKESGDHMQESYETEGNVRNICFVLPDGRMKFLNYAYLVSGEYLPEDGVIILAFTSDTVKIQGSNLITLFNDLLVHKVKNIVCLDERYNTSLVDGPIVNLIEMKNI